MEKSDDKFVRAYDVPEESFAFIDNEGRLRFFTDYMLSSRRGKDAGVDKVISLIFNIQEILQKNGVDVEILSESDLNSHFA